MSPRVCTTKTMKGKCAVVRSSCTWAPATLVVVTLAVALSGGLLAIYWTDVFNYIVASSLRLSPNGFRYQIWRDTPVPNYIEFYFFNWTNSEQFLEPGIKPRFQEVGPYRFLETKLKTDLVWNDNYTISYTQDRKWFFDPDNSNGSLTDRVTTINIIALSAAYVLRDWNYYLLLPFNQILKNYKLAITHPVSEFLFDGYEDPLINLGRLGSIFDNAIKLTDDKFGWFYKRNGSRLVDGTVNMATGVDDISQTGIIKQWNYQNTTEHYPGACGKVAGFTGEVLPPQRQINETLEIYFQDICRTLNFEHSGDVLVDDIPSFEYTASLNNLDNGTLDPSTACYCGANCLPSGVLNVSSCKLGAPAFVSYPHFYQADPYYLDLLEGLTPDKEKHSFRIYVEPKTGIPIDMFARLQVNLLVQPYKSLSLLAKIPKVFFPMMWFQQRVRSTPELSTMLQRMLLLSSVGLIAAVVVCSIGTCMFLAVVYKRFYKKNPALTVTPNKQITEVSLPLMRDNKDVATSQSA